MTCREGVWKFYDLELTDSGVRASHIQSNQALTMLSDQLFTDAQRAKALIDFSRKCDDAFYFACDQFSRLGFWEDASASAFEVISLALGTTSFLNFACGAKIP